MLDISNRTPYEAESVIQIDPLGLERLVLVVKATFEFRAGRVRLAERQEPVCFADEYYGGPGTSSLRYASELLPEKPGTDVAINGSAYPRGRTGAVQVTASAQIGPIAKTVQVYGDRFWYKSLVGLSVSEPRPFVAIPLIYERAFGGTDKSAVDPRKHEAEHRNPIGVGFAISERSLVDKPLPNIEDPAEPVTSPRSRPRPTGVGFICRHWLPRRSFAGTYDQRWLAERMPLYPEDFDARFFLAAHPDMIATPHLRGGEDVQLTNLTADGLLNFRLPRIGLSFRTYVGNRWIHHGGNLSTVVIEPDVPRVLMTWHSSIECHRKRFDVRETQITEKVVLS